MDSDVLTSDLINWLTRRVTVARVATPSPAQYHADHCLLTRPSHGELHHNDSDELFSLAFQGESRPGPDGPDPAPAPSLQANF